MDPSVQCGMAIAKLWHHMRDDVNLQNLALGAPEAALAAADSTLPQGYEIRYTRSEDSHRIELTGPDGAVKTFVYEDGGLRIEGGGPRPGDGELTEEELELVAGGVETNCPYDRFADACWGGGYNFPERCDDGRAFCECSGANRHYYPCTNSYCQGLSVPCYW